MIGLLIIERDEDVFSRGKQVDCLEKSDIFLFPGPVELAGIVGHSHGQPLEPEQMFDRFPEGIKTGMTENLSFLKAGKGEEGRLEDDMVTIIESPVVKKDAFF